MSIELLLQQSSLIEVPVITAASNTLPSRVSESSTRLFSLLKPLFPDGNVHPMTSLERRGYPDCVYEIGTADTMVYESIEIAHVVNFLITIRSPDYAELVKKVDHVVQSIETNSGLNVIDYSGDYESEQEIYRIALEVEISTPIGIDSPSASIACIIPIHTQCKAATSPYDGGCISQLINCYYAAVMQAASVETIKTMKLNVSKTLLGKKSANDHHPLQYSSGNVINPGGGLAGWVDIYIDTYRIKTK